jgi:hypothetical protein
METCSKFHVCGQVKRKWVADSGKFATVTLDIPGERGIIINLRSFKDGPIDEIRGLVPGMTIECVGNISSETVKDKKGDDIKIDGYKKYVEVLTIKKLKIDPTSKQNPPKDNGNDADDMPAGW